MSIFQGCGCFGCRSGYDGCSYFPRHQALNLEKNKYRTYFAQLVVEMPGKKLFAIIQKSILAPKCIVFTTVAKYRHNLKSDFPNPYGENLKSGAQNL